MGFFERIRQSLTRTTEQFVQRVDEASRRDASHGAREVDLDTIEAAVLPYVVASDAEMRSSIVRMSNIGSVGSTRPTAAWSCLVIARGSPVVRAMMNIDRCMAFQNAAGACAPA